MKRRGFIAGIAGAGVALVAGVYRFTDLFVKHYPPTPYDDLLGKLTDREQAARLGAEAGPFNLQGRAVQLRASLRNRSLTAAANADITAGRMAEVDGWVLPQTVAWLSALAAKA
jgi:hypothetical protein